MGSRARRFRSREVVVLRYGGRTFPFLRTANMRSLNTRKNMEKRQRCLPRLHNAVTAYSSRGNLVSTPRDVHTTSSAVDVQMLGSAEVFSSRARNWTW